MTYIAVALVAALAVTAIADPLRVKRQSHTQVITEEATTHLGQVGWAANQHDETASATGVPGGWTNPGWGSPGWGSDPIPAAVGLISQGESESVQGSSTVQYSDNNLSSMTAAQTVVNAQDAAAANAMGGYASGETATMDQTAASIAAADQVATEEATVNVHAN